MNHSKTADVLSMLEAATHAAVPQHNASCLVQPAVGSCCAQQAVGVMP
jgi:hypothetical protein